MIILDLPTQNVDTMLGSIGTCWDGPMRPCKEKVILYFNGLLLLHLTPNIKSFIFYFLFFYFFKVGLGIANLIRQFNYENHLWS